MTDNDCAQPGEVPGQAKTNGASDGAKTHKAPDQTKTNKAPSRMQPKKAREKQCQAHKDDPYLRPENEDDDGYDPYSDRPPEREPLFSRDPWA